MKRRRTALVGGVRIRPANRDGRMLFMMIERFKNRDAKAIYARFTEKGRRSHHQGASRGGAPA